MKLRFTLFILLLAFVVACEDGSSDDAAIAQSAEGQGGSLATFALKGQYLYVVDAFNLNVFSLENPEKPVLVNDVNVGFDIETLFSYREYLYIGSRRGMFIYNIENPEVPVQMAEVQHFTACDPVVANDSLAFVTLHSTVVCGNDINQLETYNVENVTNPVLLSTTQLIEPKGLGLFRHYLLVCDDQIKVFDTRNPAEMEVLDQIDVRAFDVIIRGNLLIAIGDLGLYQYRLEDTENGLVVTELSTVLI